MLRLGLVGVRRGEIVKHLQARGDVHFAAVCDLKFADPDKRQQFVAQWGEIGITFEQLYHDYDRFLEHDLDAVVISSPPQFHASQCVAALQAGFHVLSEVPAVETIDQAKDLVAAVKKAQGRYFFLENCCYWAFVQAWQAMIQQQLIGDIFYAEGDYVHDIRQLFVDDQGRKTWRWDYQPIRYITHETGPLLDLLDTRGVQVVAMPSANVNTESYNQSNAVAALVTTASGAVIKLLTSFCNTSHQYHQYRVFGNKGTLETRTTEEVTLAHLHTIPHLNGPVRLPVGVSETGLSADKLQGGHGSADWRMLDVIVNAIIHDQPGGIDVYRGLDYSLVGVCAAQSVTQKGRPVEIPDPRSW